MRGLDESGDVEGDGQDGWMVDESRDSQVHIVWNPTEGQKGSTNQRKATNQRIPRDGRTSPSVA